MIELRDDMPRDQLATQGRTFKHVHRTECLSLAPEPHRRVGAG